MKTYDTILFDLDGTLTDSQEGITKCVQYALNFFGIEETDENKLRLFIGPPLQEMFMEVYGFSKEQAKIAMAKYRERFSPIGIYENKPYDGIVPMLKHLKEQGLKLVVATSKPEEFARRILDRFEMTEYLVEISGADMDGKHVAKTDVIREALRRLKGSDTAVDGVLMVGDRKYDVEGAHMCHIPCIGVGFGFAQEGELQKAGTDYFAETVAELEKLILDLAVKGK